MSELERMAHGVLMASFAGPVVPPWMFARLAAGLGSVALFPSNVQSSSQVRSLTDALREAGSGVLVATDEEAGDVTRLHVATGSPWPGNAALGVVDDVRRTELVAAGVGAELAAAGIDLDLAPVVDVNSNPANPVIGVRSFGASAELVARQAEAFVTGLQSAGVGACAKHFPGHGDTAVDSHLGLPVVDATLELLRERELVPFGAAAAGSVAVMTSHVVLPALDAGLPATLSAPVVDVLRSGLGFDGVVVTDALDMEGVSAGRGVPAAAVAAIAAGCDLLCLGADGVEQDVEAVVAAIVGAVRTGELAEERLASAVGRVRSARQRIAGLRAAAGTAEPVDVVAGAGAEGPVDVAAAVTAGLAAGREVARAAVAVDGGLSGDGALPEDGAFAGEHALPDLRGVPVIRFRTGANLAVGEVPWGLPLDGSVQGGHHPVDVTETTDVEEVMREAMSVSGPDGGPIVALVRDAHRHPWVLEALRRLDESSAHLVTVELGWPGSERLPGRTRIRTYGAARANCEALDEVLAGAGPAGSLASRPPVAPRPPAAS